MSNYFDFSQFNDSNWSQKTFQEKLKLLQEVENFYATQQGREPCPVQLMQGAESNEVAFHSEAMKVIFVNEAYLKETANESYMVDKEFNKYILVNGIIHEGIHAWQRDLINGVISPAQSKMDTSDLEKWRQNDRWGNYIEASKDYIRYRFQPFERYAWDFSHKEVDKIFDNMPDTTYFGNYKLDRDQREAQANFRAIVDLKGEEYTHRIDHEIYLKYFDDSRWGSSENRLELLQMLEKSYAAKQGRRACMITIKDFSDIPDEIATYQKEPHEIALNQRHFENANRFLLIDEVIQKGRLDYQECMANRFLYNRGRAEENIADVTKVDRKTDFLKHWFQSSERNAREYAQREIDALFTNFPELPSYNEYKNYRDEKNQKYINSARLRWGDDYLRGVDEEIKRDGREHSQRKVDSLFSNFAGLIIDDSNNKNRKPGDRISTDYLSDAYLDKLVNDIFENKNQKVNVGEHKKDKQYMDLSEEKKAELDKKINEIKNSNGDFDQTDLRNPQKLYFSCVNKAIAITNGEFILINQEKGIKGTEELAIKYLLEKGMEANAVAKTVRIYSPNKVIMEPKDLHEFAREVVKNTHSKIENIKDKGMIGRK